jgi:hypothetical protein
LLRNVYRHLDVSRVDKVQGLKTTTVTKEEEWTDDHGQTDAGAAVSQNNFIIQVSVLADWLLGVSSVTICGQEHLAVVLMKLAVLEPIKRSVSKQVVQ